MTVSPTARYLLGLSGMIFGAILDFVALAFAAQSLLAPLAACTLIVNMALAPLLAGEQPGYLEIGVTLLITFGAIVSVIFASHETKTYTLSQMLPFFVDPKYLVWVVAQLTFACFGAAVIRDGKASLEAEHGLRARNGRQGEAAAAVAPAVAVASPLSPTARLTEVARELTNIYAFLFGAIAGISAGNSLLFAKGAAEVIKAAIQSRQIQLLLQPSALVMVGGMVGSIMIQITFLNNGLRYYDVLLILPLQQAFLVISSALNGILFFHEYADFSAVQTIAFPAGASPRNSESAHQLTQNTQAGCMHMYNTHATEIQ